MQTKLTLRLDSDLIEMAKNKARASHHSLSRLVADYFRILNLQKTDLGSQSLPPLTAALKGVLKTKKSAVTERDYQKYLEEKYQ